MAKSIKVKVGKKLTAAEKKKVDKSKTAILHSTPRAKGVEAQYPIYDVVQCPWCGYIGYAWIDTDYWKTVYCPNCWNYFSA